MGERLTDDRELRALLGEARTVAVVGLSPDRGRHSYQVAAYLQEHGVRIVPVNPQVPEVLGERAYPSLTAIDPALRIDVVDVFRRAEHTPAIAREAVAIGAKALWLQEGIVNEEAARIAEEGGLDVIMGLCMQRVRRRVMGEP